MYRDNRDNNKQTYKIAFYVITVLLFALLFGQLNLASIDFNNYSTIESELLAEEPDIDQFLFRTTISINFSYIIYNYLDHTNTSYNHSNFFPKPETRAPPISRIS